MWLKSSLAVSRPRSTTRSAPRASRSAAVTRPVSAASLVVRGYWSYYPKVGGSREPAASHSPRTMRSIDARTCPRTSAS